MIGYSVIRRYYLLRRLSLVDGIPRRSDSRLPVLLQPDPRYTSLLKKMNLPE